MNRRGRHARLLAKPPEPSPGYMWHFWRLVLIKDVEAQHKRNMEATPTAQQAERRDSLSSVAAAKLSGVTRSAIRKTLKTWADDAVTLMTLTPPSRSRYKLGRIACDFVLYDQN